MKKRNKEILLAACCTGVLAFGGIGLAQAQSPVILSGGGQAQQESQRPEDQKAQEPGSGAPEGESGEDSAIGSTSIRIWGPVLDAEEGMIRMDNQSQYSSKGEVVLYIDPEHTRVLDAVNGYPVDLGDIQAGETIYAYIGPAMTMSLPPQTTAELVLCQVPADYKVPDYVKVKEMKQQENGDWTLTTVDGDVYPVPADCQISPYLTRNLVTLGDVEESSVCLIWSGESNTAQKIVLFASE